MIGCAGRCEAITGRSGELPGRTVIALYSGP